MTEDAGTWKDTNEGGNLPVEYIYVPWDHNSKLTPDLPRLTELIAERSAAGKRILVHCQCGVSRSASLLVAYVMRQQMCDLNTAYGFVKRQSPAVSPNMVLMFQLMDWARMLRRYAAGDEDCFNDVDDTTTPLSDDLAHNFNDASSS